jgi:hypothetical protein
MTQKIVVAKPGYDANTETNPDNLVFSSDYNTLKYYLDGNASITIAGDGTLKTSTTEITHDLGYVPFFIVYVNDFVNSPSKYNIVPFLNGTVVETINAEAWADTTKIYLRMTNKSNSTYTANFYYKIFRNNLNM